jgi:hypothetical protein
VFVLPIKRALVRLGVLPKQNKLKSPGVLLHSLEREAAEERGRGSRISERKRLTLDRLVARRRKQIATRPKTSDSNGTKGPLHGPYLE